MRSGLFGTDALDKAEVEGFVKMCEGTAAVLYPTTLLAAHDTTSKDVTAQGAVHDAAAEELEETQEQQSVFYNPAQVVNRDLSVCVLEVFSRLRLREPRRRGGTTAGITILEALSATGLRAIRYYKEVSHVRYIIANDLDAGAVQCIERNCVYNGVPVLHPTLHANIPDDAVEVYGEEPQARRVTTFPEELGGDAANKGGEHTASVCGKESTKANASETMPAVGVRRGGGVIANVDDANDLMHRLAVDPNVHGTRQERQRMCLVRVGATATAARHTENTQSCDNRTNCATSTACRDGCVCWGNGPVLKPVLQQELMDVVDLDPYGTAAPFLDAAFRCIKEGGLMLVTSTDSAILCGNYPGTCHAKYNALPYKRLHCHEMAVRILLAAAERVANKHGKYIVPLVSLHVDFYVRCVFRVYTQLAEAKLGACKLGYQLQCTHCPAYWIQPITDTRAPRRRRHDAHTPHHANSSAAAAHKRVRDDTDAVFMAGGSSHVKVGVNDEEERKANNSCSHETDVPHPEPTNATTSDELTTTTAHVPRPQLFPIPPNRSHDAKVVCTTLHQLGRLQATRPDNRDNDAAAYSSNTSSSGCRGNGRFCSNDDRNRAASDTTDVALGCTAPEANMCPVCGSAVALSGPIYAAATQDSAFIQQLLAVVKERASANRLTAVARVQGLLLTAVAELPQCPLFYEPQEFSSYVRVRCPSTPSLVGALHRLGYRCSQVHCSATGLKTDCPPDVMMSVMLRWKASQNAKETTKCDSANTYEMHGDESTTCVRGEAKKTSMAVPQPRLCVSALAQADFSYDKKYDYRRPVTGVAKFVPNAPGWGPKRRHVGVVSSSSTSR